MPTFICPTAFTGVAFTPDSKGIELGLARYRNTLIQGVTVFKLSNGTYVQDYPTAENSDTNLPPYPLMPDQGPNFPNLIDVSYTGATPGNPVTRVTTAVNPYVVTTYYGGHQYTVSNAEAAALTAVGYGSCITS